MPLRPDLLAKFKEYNSLPKNTASISELAKRAIEQNIASCIVKSPEIIADRLETAKQELSSLAEFIAQNETDPTEKQQAIDNFMATWKVTYNDETDAIETWKLDPTTGEPIPLEDNPELSLNFRRLEGELVLPDHLQITKLDCIYNQLTSLGNLPTSLTWLYCNSNQLTSLGDLPTSLTKLDCNSNQLTSLDNLPTSLTRLCCYENQLTTLDNLPTSLTWLYCSKNQLTTSAIAKIKANLPSAIV